MYKYNNTKQSVDICKETIFILTDLIFVLVQNTTILAPWQPGSYVCSVVYLNIMLTNIHCVYMRYSYYYVTFNV